MACSKALEGEDDHLDLERLSFLPDRDSGDASQPADWHSKQHSLRLVSAKWVYFLLALLSGSTILNIHHLVRRHSCSFRTDIQDARHAVQYEERVYTGALHYNGSEGRVFRALDANTEYFGYPDKRIDDAWAELLQGGYLEMTEREARPFAPDLRRIGDTGKYFFEPDVFHSLHCLNEIRIHVSKTLYNASESDSVPHHHASSVEFPPGWEEAHLEHCMDRIRQSIMCHGDLTPSPLYTWPGFNLALGKAGTHTCRKWEPIMRWVEDRQGRGAWLPPMQKPKTGD